MGGRRADDPSAGGVVSRVLTTPRLTIRPPTYGGLRLTIPAHERLLDAGSNVVRADYMISRDGPWAYEITLTTPPPGLVQVLVRDQWAAEPAMIAPSQRPGAVPNHRALRCDDEPEYPGEWPDAVAWHEHGQWVPCPTCGSALVWYEAGYVLGYRICVRRTHHAQLSANGRTAKAVRR